jgi:hypothetical protein
VSATNIIIAIAAQTASAIRDIDGVTKALQNQATGTEKAQAAVKSMAVPAGIAFAAVSAGGLKAAAAAEEAAAESAKLNQVFQSMGYADLADDAEAYAEALSKQIGVDDEVIKSAQTKLATFDQIAKSADLMGQATTMAADMAAAGFGTMDSASVMLGKALQDPVKGMTALGKVGVTFTEQQKAQIKAMVEAGDVAGAQGMIMEALGTQVGGVAEASAKGSDKLKTSFGEIEESVGAALLPALEALMGPLQSFADWAADNGEVIAAIGVTIGVLAGAVLAVNAAIAIWTAVSTIATAATAAFGVAVTIATSPITLIIAAILAVIAVGYLLVKNWDDISAWLIDLWNGIKDFATRIWNSIKDFFGNTWDSIKNTTKDAWESVKRVVTEGISSVVQFVREMPGKIVSAIGNLISLLTSKGVDLIQGFIKGYMSLWGNVIDFMIDIPKKIVSAIGNMGSLLYNKGKDLIQGFIDGIKSMASKAANAVSSILPGGKSSSRAASGVDFYGSRSSRAMGIGGGLTVNMYGDPVSNERVLKRALEGYDISMGRAPGQPLARAW